MINPKNYNFQVQYLIVKKWENINGLLDDINCEQMKHALAILLEYQDRQIDCEFCYYPFTVEMSNFKRILKEVSFRLVKLIFLDFLKNDFVTYWGSPYVPIFNRKENSLGSKIVFPKITDIHDVSTSVLKYYLSRCFDDYKRDKLVSMLYEKITSTINIEIIQSLTMEAETNYHWCYQCDKIINQKTKLYHTCIHCKPNYFNTSDETISRLRRIIVKMSNRIHTKTLWNCATFLVTSPKIYRILNTIPGFSPTVNASNSVYKYGLHKVGELVQLNVYTTTCIDQNIILMGCKGEEMYKYGAIVALNTVLINPLVRPRTSYASEVINRAYSGNIIVYNLPDQ